MRIPGAVAQLSNSTIGMPRAGAGATTEARTTGSSPRPQGDRVLLLQLLGGQSSTIDASGGRPQEATTASKLPKATQLLGQGGKDSLLKETKAHEDQRAKTGVGKYYGAKSKYAELKKANPKFEGKYLDRMAKPGTEPAAPKETDCIKWSMQHLKAAYAKAGKSRRWARIESKVAKGGFKGTDLAKELHKDGWKPVYFNRDVANSPAKTEHKYSADIALKGGLRYKDPKTGKMTVRKDYYGIPGKQMAHITDYAPVSGEPGSAKSQATMNKLKKAPFYFGYVKGGKHTFVGHEGKINEQHWDKSPHEDGQFEQHKSLADFSKSQGWHSGVIMVPPGSWK